MISESDSNKTDSNIKDFNECLMEHRTKEEQENIRLKVIQWFKDMYKPDFEVEAIIDDDYSVRLIKVFN